MQMCFKEKTQMTFLDPNKENFKCGVLKKLSRLMSLTGRSLSGSRHCTVLGKRGLGQRGQGRSPSLEFWK
ncbi:hypothetical protein BpHYR1_013644 [Brachionus plicatilis]|uniref:Uncharacterized protein n=1 Tax=Brachionus plicatilis TaxID=10195 RepID=A0A3M7SXF6_BRAPC|nr:hypothetical protein BpHYR1_013644 [Brachionus plicatilis]